MNIVCIYIDDDNSDADKCFNNIDNIEENGQKQNLI